MKLRPLAFFLTITALCTVWMAAVFAQNPSIGWKDYTDYSTWAADFAANGTKVRQDYRTGYVMR